MRPSRCYYPYRIICMSCGGIIFGTNSRHYCTMRCRAIGRTSIGMKYRRIRDLPPDEISSRELLGASNQLADRLVSKLISARLEYLSERHRKDEKRRNYQRGRPRSRRWNDLRSVGL